MHVGTRGKITELRKGDMHTGASATIEQDNGEKFSTLVENLIVVG